MRRHNRRQPNPAQASEGVPVTLHLNAMFIAGMNAMKGYEYEQIWKDIIKRYK